MSENIKPLRKEMKCQTLSWKRSLNVTETRYFG